MILDIFGKGATSGYEGEGDNSDGVTMLTFKCLLASSYAGGSDILSCNAMCSVMRREALVTHCVCVSTFLPQGWL